MPVVQIAKRAINWDHVIEPDSVTTGSFVSTTIYPSTPGPTMILPSTTSLTAWDLVVESFGYLSFACSILLLAYKLWKYRHVLAILIRMGCHPCSTGREFAYGSTPTELEATRSPNRNVAVIEMNSLSVSRLPDEDSISLD